MAHEDAIARRMQMGNRGTDTVERDVVVELINDKTPKVLQALPEASKGWKVQYALFARMGFTPATRTLVEKHQAQLVDLKRLDQDLGKQ